MVEEALHDEVFVVIFKNSSSLKFVTSISPDP